MDPSGHASQGAVVEALINIARNKTSKSQRFWSIRSKLGTQALNFFPDAKEDGNNTFNYLFNIATSSSSDGQADWAKQQLVNAFETKYQYDLAAFDQYISGLLISLDLNIFRTAKTKVMNAAKKTQVGVIGEIKLAELVGGRPNVYFKTSLGGRYVDQLSNGIAYESKTGFVKYGESTLAWKQIKKDAELLRTEAVDGVYWYFFRSPQTGKVGADPRILSELTKNGIKYKIFE